MTEVHSGPILSHWCHQNCVDVTTLVLLHITVFATVSCSTGVVGSCALQAHCVVADLRAHWPPVHPESVVGPAIELDASWTAGTYRKVRGLWVLCVCAVFVLFNIIIFNSIIQPCSPPFVTLSEISLFITHTWLVFTVTSSQLVQIFTSWLSVSIVNTVILQM